MFEVHLKLGKNGNWYWGMYEVERNPFGDITYFKWRFGSGPAGFESKKALIAELDGTIRGSIPLYDADGKVL